MHTSLLEVQEPAGPAPVIKVQGQIFWSLGSAPLGGFALNDFKGLLYCLRSIPGEDYLVPP